VKHKTSIHDLTKNKPKINIKIDPGDPIDFDEDDFLEFSVRGRSTTTPKIRDEQFITAFHEIITPKS